MSEEILGDSAFIRDNFVHLNGNLNKHNAHFWCTENPHEKVMKPATTASLTVWACISFSGVLAFDISRQTMNSERYNNILNEKVIPYFNRNRQLLFQQDGAPSHYATIVRNNLDENLTGRWIGRRGPIERPACSPDLTVCDFFF